MRRRVMASLAKSGAFIPYDAEVEYLEGTGTQYIHVDGVILPSGKISIRYFTASETTQMDIFGAYWYGGKNRRTLYVQMYNRWGGLRINQAPPGYTSTTYQVGAKGWNADCALEIDLSNGDVYFNGAFETTIENFDTTHSIDGYNLFYHYGENQNKKFTGRIYSFSYANESGVKVIDLVPVRFTNENGDNEGAMYDRVSGQLFRNAGEGGFLIGPDVA